MISEYTVPWVTVENPCAAKLAVHWMDSPDEEVAAAGWCSYAGLVRTKPNDQLNLPEITELLKKVASDLAGAKNRVRYTMNGFVISVGSYIEPLVGAARAAAGKIGVVEVNMGETACSVPLASEAIDQAAGMAKKRKTIRC